MDQSTAELVQQLNNLITLQLDNCNTQNTPHICRMKSTPEGNEAVREAIMRQCASTGCGVGQAIIDLEREYGFTGHD